MTTPDLRRGLRLGVGLDLAVVLAWGVLDLLTSFDPNYPGALELGWTVAYALPGYALLLVRRRWPVRVFAVLLAHSMLGMVVAPGYLPTLELWVGLFAMAARAPLSRAVAASLATSGPLLITELVQLERHPGTNPVRTVAASVAFWVVVTVAVVVAGRWVRRSSRDQNRVAEQAAAQAVGAERARIAQDLHDVVSHSLTLMTLQAGVAGRLLESNPVAAAQALDGVGELGQQAGTELHRLLGLWDDPDAGADSELGTGHDLVGLVERARRGMPNLVLTVDGHPRTLTTGIGEAAYRVIQEALTNASRFGDPDHAVAVTLEWAADEVGVTVVNHLLPGPDQRARAGRGGGRGLAGMSQRVRRCGGEFSTRTSGDGRFIVSARLPVAHPAAALPRARRARGGKALLSSIPSLFF